MKKKLLSALLATAMTASMLAGCGSDAASGDAGQKQDAADRSAHHSDQTAVDPVLCHASAKRQMVMQYAGQQCIHTAEYQAEQQVHEKAGNCHRALALAFLGYE